MNATKTSRIQVELPPLHPAQQAIADSPARFRVLACGRRFGKSALGCVEGLGTALRGGRAWIISPTFPMATVNWREIKALAVQIPMEMSIREADRMIAFPNGGYVQIKSAHEPVGLRGEGLDFVALDEAAFLDEETWTDSLRPALSDRKGKALFLSTPNGRNWFFRLFQQASRDTSGEWAIWQLPTSANPLIDPVEIEAARADMPESIYMQEYFADFARHSGMVYTEFTRAIHVTDAMPKHPKSAYAGIDYGFANPGCILVGLVDDDENLYITREVYAREKVVEEWGEVGKQLNIEYKLDKMFVDPSRPDFIDILNAHKCNAVGAENDVLIGINAVKTRLRNAAGQTTLFIHPSCVNLIDEMESYTWMDNRDGFTDKPRKTHDHAVDSLRYLCVGLHRRRPLKVTMRRWA